jgi:protein-tyrosine phosphatase
VFKRVLVVCVGNICRSPTAEYLLKARLAQGGCEIISAGTNALVNRPMDPTAALVLEEHGIDGSAHRGQQLTTDLMRSSDLILTMEKSHIAAVTRGAPEVIGKVFLLGKWQADVEIPDPYGRQRPAFDHAYRLIDAGVGDWLRHLNNP